MPAFRPPSPQEDVLIIGAGVFGLSLAYELKARRGYDSVTVLDRHLPPVPDGSSVDISRIIRSEYADSFYESLARDAIQEWREPDFSSFYHESGFVMLAADDGNPYFVKARDRSAGSVKVDIWGSDESNAAIRSAYPGATADLTGLNAAHNTQGGWVDAAASIRALAARASSAGVSFMTGQHGTVTELLRDDPGKRVVGVQVASGATFKASRVVLAAGAWTNGLIGGLEHAVRGSGQPVAFIQLTPAEAAAMEPTPVIINMDSGVFTFPPTPDTHILKVVRHGFGYATKLPAQGDRVSGERLVSVPKTNSCNASADFIPEDAEQGLREGLRVLAPAYAERPFIKTRLCWYNDTPEGNFVVDDHPEIEGLFIATGGSGHAFKFLPVIGKQIADCFEAKASAEVRAKWRLRAAEPGQSKLVMAGDGSRGGPALRHLSREEQERLLERFGGGLWQALKAPSRRNRGAPVDGTC
ncbi:hypothetical protein VDGE_08214 [Verticillium dahliae]|nr:hypothetical protein VDGE_08214 [Verticillium dahliae]